MPNQEAVFPTRFHQIRKILAAPPYKDGRGLIDPKQYVYSLALRQLQRNEWSTGLSHGLLDLVMAFRGGYEIQVEQGESSD